MHKKNIFITLLFFAFSWGWSNNSALDTVYHKAADASVPDTIYVIESSTESELAQQRQMSLFLPHTLL